MLLLKGICYNSKCNKITLSGAKKQLPTTYITAYAV
ncbi:hypothetical protein HNQ56_003385 [Anaerotaenia torta]